MTPIVHGLEQKYSGEVDFQMLDAATGEGAKLFGHYGLLGHPSYVLLDPTGRETWRGIGPAEVSLLQGELLKLIEP